MNEKNILTDVMGTISPASFLETIMEDFKQNGESFIQSFADPDFMRIVENLRKESGKTTPAEIVKYVADQLNKRVLSPDYLALSGAVTVDAYLSKRLQAPFFDDVPATFSRWTKEEGKTLYIFSNGSEHSQRVMFLNATLVPSAARTNLAAYVNGRFIDTADAGKKNNSDSYLRIADKIIKAAPEEIHFLSDLVEELDAACKAGMPVTMVNRPGNKPQPVNKYNAVTSFADL